MPWLLQGRSKRSRAAHDDHPEEGKTVRKLIRPDLTELKEQRPAPAYRQRKPVPPEQTHAESFYFKKQMDNRTRMVLVLQDGERLVGTIEWYDRNCIKLHR